MSKRKADHLDKVYIPRFTGEWITPSKTRNAMLNDYILDWLDMYGESKGYVPDTKYDTYDPELDFGKYIMEQGNRFEAYIAEELQKRFRDEFIEVKDTDPYQKAKTTLELMKSGTPIIYQGTIFNSQIKVYGTPDLIVRSDYINRIVKTKTVSDNDQPGCTFSQHWHYRIIDIKFHTLHLKANFTTICDDNTIRAFKAQCYLYTQCLQHIQKYMPRKAYILGRGWTATSKSVEYYSGDPFNKLGTINYYEDDINICEDSMLAIQWLTNLRKEGRNWDLLPKPSVPELYPNMKITSHKWNRIKEDVAHKLEELTLIYNCGYYNRIYAHMKGVYKISDPKCIAKSLDISGKRNTALVDGLLYTYRHPKPIFHASGKPLPGFYVDIESVSSVHNIMDNTDNRTYMIGVGYYDISGKWIYRSFVCNRLDEGSENQMFCHFVEYLGTVRKNINEGITNTNFASGGITNTIYHYNSTDKNELERIANRIHPAWSKGYRFVDVYKILKNGIFIPGCLNFSLKSISKALGRGRYDDSEINSGVNSMIWAIRYYEKVNTPSASGGLNSNFTSRVVNSNSASGGVNSNSASGGVNSNNLSSYNLSNILSPASISLINKIDNFVASINTQCVFPDSSNNYSFYMKNIQKYNEFDCLALSDVVQYIHGVYPDKLLC